MIPSGTSGVSLSQLSTVPLAPAVMTTTNIVSTPQLLTTGGGQPMARILTHSKFCFILSNT